MSELESLRAASRGRPRATGLIAAPGTGAGAEAGDAALAPLVVLDGGRRRAGGRRDRGVRWPGAPRARVPATDLGQQEVLLTVTVSPTRSLLPRRAGAFGPQPATTTARPSSLLVVTVTGSPPPVSALEVRSAGPAGTSSESYTRGERASDHLSDHAQRRAARQRDREPEHRRGRARRHGRDRRDGPERAMTIAPAADVRRSTCRSAAAARACTADAGTGSTPDAGRPPPAPAAATGASTPARPATSPSRAGDPGACPPPTATTASPARPTSRAAAPAPPPASTRRSPTSASPTAAVRRGPRSRPTPTAPRPAATASSRPARPATPASPPASPAPAPRRASARWPIPARSRCSSRWGPAQAICLHYQVDAVTVGRRLLPARRHQRRRQRLSDRLRRRRPARERVVRRRHRSTGAGKLPGRLRRRQRLHHRLLSGAGCHATCASRADHDADLGRRLLPPRRDARHRHRLPRQLRRRHRRAR